MRILFIGNSHTYMNDMPELARRMIEDATKEPCEVVMLAYSGRSLKWHMEEEYFSERFSILHGKYDFCVIQEQAHPLLPEDETAKYATRIAELCKKVGTTPVIFETWAEKVKPENQAEMNRRYRALAGKLDAKLAPIGEVWNEVRNSSDLELYFRDGEHASAVGDYLIAMALTKVLTGALPGESFRTAFDFTVPEDFQPVKEDVSQEIVELDAGAVAKIREAVNCYC